MQLKTATYSFHSPSHFVTHWSVSVNGCNRLGSYILYFYLVLYFQAKTISLKEGELTEAKQAGRDLAEQFIEKYPESFKIRFSDKMSMRKLTYIQEICRDRRTDRAVEIFEKVLAGDLECLEDEKKDLDALLDLFAYHNTDTATTQWATSYVCWSIFSQVVSLNE